MATFEAQVEALTGIAISGSSSPTQTELTQFLRDGVIDVINRIILIRPDELHKFANTTHDDSNSGITLTGQIISIMREHDSTSILRVCHPISVNERYDATDTDSLKYRSKYNPGYYILNKKIFCAPVSAGSNNDLIVTQVHYDETITYGSDDMQHFPREYIYLVPLYGAIKSLENSMAGLEGDGDLSTALTAANTELDETQTVCDSINTNVAAAVTQLGEAATAVDANIDTATAAIATAAGRIDTAVQLANLEFDKCDTILDKGEVDTEADVNTALAAMVTELNETQAICDKIDAEVVLANGEVDDAFIEVGLARIEAAELALQTDNSGDFETALDAINTAVDKFRADGDDPALFGDQSQYTTGEGLTHVKDALELARDAIDTGFATDEDSGGTDDATPKSAGYWLNDEDPEMVTATLETAQTEIARAQVHIEEWNAVVTALSTEISGFAAEVQARASFSGAKAQAVNAYLGTAQGYLNAAQGYLGTAQGYSQELAAKISISNGYAGEIQMRLSQAQAKREESISRVEVGNAYLGEANAAAMEVQSYVNEVSARVQQVSGYSEVIGGYLQSAQGFATEIMTKINIAQGYMAEHTGRLQQIGAEYQWKYQRHAILKRQYDEAFGLMAPRQQGGQGEG